MVKEDLFLLTLKLYLKNNFMKDLTVVIVTYRTPKKIITNCIRSIQKNVKILIIENSSNFEHNSLLKKFPNLKILCTGKNLGYGKGNNFGLVSIKTKYVLILNPDIVCEKNLFKSISSVIRKKINFHIIGCQYLKDKVFMPAGYFDYKKNEDFKKTFHQKNIKLLTRVEWVKGCSMLINLKKFKNKNIFDKNYFLFFEEFDLCKSIIDKNGNIFTCNEFKVHHLGFKSSLGKNLSEKINANNVKDWHWMWSSFYFYKKNYNFFYATYKLIGKLIKSFFKIIIYSSTFQKNKKDKYLYRFLGLFNSFIDKPSYFRGKD